MVGAGGYKAIVLITEADKDDLLIDCWPAIERASIAATNSYLK